MLKSWSTLITSLMLCFVISCTAPESTSDQPQTEQKPTGDAEQTQKDEKSSEDFSLDNYRSSLRDIYASKKHDVPEVFLTYRKKEEKKGDDRTGFRIQIHSSRRVSKADSASRRFTNWVDTLDIDYQPRSYIIFKQPYYRVHVGDFSQRDKAIDYSRWIKREFPEAWVVHDKINPQKTPEAMRRASADADSAKSDSVTLPDTTRQNPPEN